MDRKWTSVPHQDKLQDGTWLAYFKEIEDTRDIMSDCIRPSWGATGKYEVEIMKPNAHNTSDYSIRISTDKKAGNWLSVTIRRHFYSYQALEDWLVTFCKALGTYRTGNGHIYGEITEELYKKYREVQRGRCSMITAIKTDKGYQLVALSRKTGQPFMKINNFGPYKTAKTANTGLKRAAALFNTEYKEVQE